MKTIYVVSSIPVRQADGTIIGWVRADPFADGTKPTDAVFLRDGTGCGQAEAAELVRRDPGLLYPTRDDAVSDGLRGLRDADARGELQAL